MNQENQFTAQRQLAEQKETDLQYLSQLKKRKTIAIIFSAFSGLQALSCLTKMPALIEASGAGLAFSALGVGVGGCIFLTLLTLYLNKKIEKLQKHINETY